MAAKGEVVPVLMASAPGGRGASYFHLFTNTPAGGTWPSDCRWSMIGSNCLSSFRTFNSELKVLRREVRPKHIAIHVRV